ncbi:hypothetical protein FQZ97_1075150 [compost metagenome]
MRSKDQLLRSEPLFDLSLQCKTSCPPAAHDKNLLNQGQCAEWPVGFSNQFRSFLKCAIFTGKLVCQPISGFGCCRFLAVEDFIRVKGIGRVVIF